MTDSARAAVIPRANPNGWARLAVTACIALLIGGLAACGTDKATSSATQGRTPGESSATTSTPPPLVTTGPVASVTTVAVVQVGCRTETAPTGIDTYGVSHTGEKICTWGPELESRLDSHGFVTPSQNHPVDLAMAKRCWSAGGRLYLRTPASNGWACIGPGGGKATIAAGCANGIVSDAIRTALVHANGLPGGQVLPGRSYYGVCGSTSYAVARFGPAAGATFQERVSFQDDGSDIRFFTKPDGGTWTAVGMVAYDLTPTCATFPQLPAALKALWDNCPLA